jgi:DNA replication initiation complex subunit (GINS family)
MITYNDIYEAARKERYAEQLQPIAKNFVSEVSVYLREKKELASKEDDDFSDVAMKTKKQLENAIILFKELLLRRRKKILNLVLIAAETGISKQDFDNMLALEKDLFEDIMKCMDISDKKLNESLNGKNEGKVIQNELIVFLKDVEEFVGLTGEKMGPFIKGQIANLPSEITKILIEGKNVELVGEE